MIIIRGKDAKLHDRLREGITRLTGLLSDPGLIEPEDVVNVLKEGLQLRQDVERRSRKLLYRIGFVDGKFKEDVGAYLGLCSSFPEDVIRHNETVARRLAVDIGDMINPVEGRDLDLQQLTTLAMDVHTRLVLAGAGTGKTTTLVGLVKYLLTSGKAVPDDILALSFTNASVDELRERIRKETGQRVETTTFHRLAVKVIASSEGKVPKISNLDLRRFVSDEIHRRASDPSYMKVLNEYLVYDYDGQRDESSFTDRSEYVDYLRDNPLITLKGERVKSFGEAEIANFLAINGIPYQYEAPYVKDTNDASHGQYRPDFHLTDTDIYIEYFGTDRKGRVAPFMVDKGPEASERYLEGIGWKRNTHEVNGTRLIELFAYNRSEGVLLELLEKKLKEYGVTMDSPMSPDLVFEAMLKNDKWRFNSFVSDVVTILTLVKGTGEQWDDAYPKDPGFIGRRKGRRLENVLRPLYDAYQKTLSDAGEIDFEDMLNMASGCIRDGRWHHPYRYVIVDEYQDISRSRFRLLESMRQDVDYRLYCVGDDWQSIYRFNGSDVSYILDFEKHWGPSSVCRIETTYRFGGELLRTSSDFICRNSRQCRKDLKSAGNEDCPVIPVVASSQTDMRRRIGEILGQVPDSSEVLFLGRYNHDVNVLTGDGFSWKPVVGERSVKVTYSQREDLDMRFMTIHGSKGLQADYVVSLNNSTGRYGFPGNRDESPVIGMLLGGEDTQYDEERRLFYVSMTRARKCLYLATYEGRQSQYFREIFHVGTETEKERFCPLCGGRLVLRKGKFGEFMGCENFGKTRCRFTCDNVYRQPTDTTFQSHR